MTNMFPNQLTRVSFTYPNLRLWRNLKCPAWKSEPRSLYKCLQPAEETQWCYSLLGMGQKILIVREQLILKPVFFVGKKCKNCVNIFKCKLYIVFLILLIFFAYFHKGHCICVVICRRTGKTKLILRSEWMPLQNGTAANSQVGTCQDFPHFPPSSSCDIA